MGDKKKNYFKNYYLKKIKPFLKRKGEAQQLRMRCLMCGHWIDYKKYMEKTPTIRIEVKLWRFGGRANIKVTDYAKMQPELVRNLEDMIRNKLKMMLRALGVEVEQAVIRIDTPRRETNLKLNVPLLIKSSQRIGGLR